MGSERKLSSPASLILKIFHEFVSIIMRNTEGMRPSNTGIPTMKLINLIMSSFLIMMKCSDENHQMFLIDFTKDMKAIKMRIFLMEPFPFHGIF